MPRPRAGGGHTIDATADAAAGNQASADVGVTVPADTASPSVSISSPASGATVSGTIQVQASASDDVGVTRVELMVDGVVKSTLASAPWSFGLDTTALANGGHTLAATAYDAVGNGSSAQVSVGVQNTPSDTTAPSKPSGLRVAVAGTTQIAFYWTPSTDNAGVTAYEVYRDGVKVAETSLPNYLDSGLAPATSHKCQVFARDAAGNRSAASSAVTGKTIAVSTSSSGTIAGVFYNAAGRPEANIVVQLSGNGITKSYKTGSNGIYKFSSLPPGPYTVAITLSTTGGAAAPGALAEMTVVGTTVVGGRTILLIP